MRGAPSSSARCALRVLIGGALRRSLVGARRHCSASGAGSGPTPADARDADRGRRHAAVLDARARLQRAVDDLRRDAAVVAVVADARRRRHARVVRSAGRAAAACPACRASPSPLYGPEARPIAWSGPTGDPAHRPDHRPRRAVSRAEPARPPTDVRVAGGRPGVARSARRDDRRRGASAARRRRRRNRRTASCSAPRLCRCRSARFRGRRSSADYASSFAARRASRWRWSTCRRATSRRPMPGGALSTLAVEAR